jgi:hypothetical protein
MSQTFDMHAFVVYLLKNFGPFQDTVEGFQESIANDGGTYEIVIDPDGKGNVLIDIRESEDDEPKLVV